MVIDRVLVATRAGQGLRANDFFCGVEGELVALPLTCCSFGSVDDDCGCRRCFRGLQSYKATTTALVVPVSSLEVPLASTDAWATEIAAAERYRLGSFASGPCYHALIAERALLLGELAMAYPVGTVLEIRGGQAGVREVGE